jgi:hypothetical protein
MKPTPVSDAVQSRSEIAALFRSAPVLVEVRFPHMATSPDWYLCEEEEELASILGRLGSGAELRLISVWNLKSTGREVVLRK